MFRHHFGSHNKVRNGFNAQSSCFHFIVSDFSCIQIRFQHFPGLCCIQSGFFGDFQQNIPVFQNDMIVKVRLMQQISYSFPTAFIAGEFVQPVGIQIHGFMHLTKIHIDVRFIFQHVIDALSLLLCIFSAEAFLILEDLHQRLFSVTIFRPVNLVRFDIYLDLVFQSQFPDGVL